MHARSSAQPPRPALDPETEPTGAAYSEPCAPLGRAPRAGAAGVVAAGLFAVGLAATSSRAQVACEELATPAGGTVAIWMQIDDPAPGTVFEADDECRLAVQLSGTFGLEVDLTLDHDYYLVLDESASCANDSGTDVDGNGSPGDIPGDSIFSAEVTAAIRFVEALDPATSRVAVIGFSSEAVVHEALSSDLDRVLATLDALLLRPPGGGTVYSAALGEVHAQAITRGDPATRVQRALFLSDGNPDAEDRPLVHPAAELLADAGVRTDTFSLDVPTALALEDIALTTGGRFHPLAEIGDILEALPDAIDDLGFSLSSRNGSTGEAGSVAHDLAAGWFTAGLELSPGPNSVELRIEVPSLPPTTLTCSMNLLLQVVPGPADIGRALRVGRERDGNLLLRWEHAPDLGARDGDVVRASESPNGVFAPLEQGIRARRLLLPPPAGRLLFFDVRRASCESVLSED